LLTVICFPHAEDVAFLAAWGVSHNDHPPSKQAKANDPRFTILLANVLYFDGDSRKDGQSVFEVQTPLPERLVALRGIVGDAHGLL
jgi:hypothetical protein